MLNYYSYFKKLLENKDKYNLYFGTILLAKLALECSIPRYKFYEDIKYLKNFMKIESEHPEIAMLDITDGSMAYTDVWLQEYATDDIIKLLEVF